jgi:hypothetical protein
MPQRPDVWADLAVIGAIADRGAAMEMKRLTGGNLRAVGYDDRRRSLVVELTSGIFEYGGVSAETYRMMLSASSPWSYFRDNIDEEYPAKRVR